MVLQNCNNNVTKISKFDKICIIICCKKYIIVVILLHKSIYDIVGEGQ